MFSFFHRAIGYIMSTLFYPIVTFILIAICISYWAVTAVYPSVCAHLWRTVFCSARKNHALWYHLNQTHVDRAIWSLSTCSTDAGLFLTAQLGLMYKSDSRLNFIKKNWTKILANALRIMQGLSILHKMDFNRRKKALSKEGIWPLMCCVLYRPNVNGLLAGEAAGAFCSEKYRKGMRIYRALSPL